MPGYIEEPKMKTDSLAFGGPIRFSGRLFDGRVTVHEFEYPKSGYSFSVRAWYDDTITFDKYGISYSKARKIARKIAGSLEKLSNREITNFPSRNQISACVSRHLK